MNNVRMIFEKRRQRFDQFCGFLNLSSRADMNLGALTIAD